MSQDYFSRSKALNNIPQRKIQEKLLTIENSNDSTDTKNIKSIAYNRYAESNIPLEYWELKMERDFIGDKSLLAKYEEVVNDLKFAYTNGTSICFAGPHGVGKSFSSISILKKASQKGFSCQYSEMTNIISVITQASSEEKFLAKRELSIVDFLVIDEVDIRFFSSSEAANELYAKNLESIFRTRKQNKLPTIICTNSPNILESFTGALKQSLGSLFSNSMQIVPVFGEDFRKIKKG